MKMDELEQSTKQVQEEMRREVQGEEQIGLGRRLRGYEC